MMQAGFSVGSTRRRLLAGGLALAGDTLWGQKKYAPRIVCNTYLWVQLFSTPVRYISSSPTPRPAPKKEGSGASPGARRPSQGDGWTEENWHTCFGDVQAAGYRRIELTSGTWGNKPVEDLGALLKKYGLLLNHLYHGGPMYPAEAADKTIGRVLELADQIKVLTRILLFDPFQNRSQLTDEEARTQVRSLDRLGRELKDRGMELSIHNHMGPMPDNGSQWLYVLRNTDPGLVSFCLDLDWTWQAGTDPMPLLYEAGDKGRLGMIHMRTQHMKLTDQTMEDGGDVDFYKVAEYLRKIRFDGFLVEETEYMKDTKVTRSARENKRIARTWCEKVYGVSAKT